EDGSISKTPNRKGSFIAGRSSAMRLRQMPIGVSVSPSRYYLAPIVVLVLVNDVIAEVDFGVRSLQVSGRASETVRFMSTDLVRNESRGVAMAKLSQPVQVIPLSPCFGNASFFYAIDRKDGRESTLPDGGYGSNTPTACRKSENALPLFRPPRQGLARSP